MTLKTEESASSVAPLNSNDRCDYARCGAQAYVRATGVSGELLFCAHHYNGIMDNAVGYDSMIKFAYFIMDERDKILGK
jgi:hypothetical protein